MSSYETLPDNLPTPVDDGACAHLVGMSLPDLDLPTTGGGSVNLSKLPRKTVVYCYPMTGVPGVALPDGWDEIPGARGLFYNVLNKQGQWNGDWEYIGEDPGKHLKVIQELWTGIHLAKAGKKVLEAARCGEAL